MRRAARSTSTSWRVSTGSATLGVITPTPSSPTRWVLARPFRPSHSSTPSSRRSVFYRLPLPPPYKEASLLSLSSTPSTRRSVFYRLPLLPLQRGQSSITFLCSLYKEASEQSVNNPSIFVKRVDMGYSNEPFLVRSPLSTVIN